MHPLRWLRFWWQNPLFSQAELILTLNAIHHSLAEIGQIVLDTQEILCRVHKEESQMSVAMDDVRTQVGNLKVGLGTISDGIAALASRLEDNPSTSSVQEVAADLRSLVDKTSAIAGDINSLDPDVPGGAIDATEPPAADPEDPAAPPTVDEAPADPA